jgi:hypothetical protein
MNIKLKGIKYTKELLENATKNSNTISDVLRFLNLKTSSNWHTYISKRIKDFNINIDHFLGPCSSRGKISHKRKSPLEILVLRNNDKREKHSLLKRALLEIGVEYKCNICKIDKWLDKDISLDIHHKNGNWSDDRRENLEFLCPNCHSFTDTFRSKNIKLKKNKNYCIDCNIIIRKSSKRCYNCSHIFKKNNKKV